jgi:hypothetical protein
MSLYAPDDPNRTFVDALIAADQFEVVFDEQQVLVAKRITPGPAGEDVPVNCDADGETATTRALQFISGD